MSRLRGFQKDVQDQCFQAWDAGAKVVMPVMSTGAGKTVLMADTIRVVNEPGVSIAHRSELVSQISLALAQEEVRHDIVAPDATIRAIVAEQTREFGYSYYQRGAMWKVASVDTIIRRQLDASWLKRVRYGNQDEGHHVLLDNKWGRALQLFGPDVRWMLPTATPKRADGKGLGRHAHGVVDTLVQGPELRWLIDNAYLTEYRIVAPPPPSDLDLSQVHVTSGGDYNQKELATATKRSNKIVGDVVQTYLKWARGLRGITFAVDVEHATTIADEYNRNGVPAQVVHANTPDTDRIQYMREFRAGKLLQLVNVDLFGEGVDVPACQCVSFARKTKSYGLYVQQFGRALRLMISKLQAAAWDTYTVATRKQLLAESEKPVAFIFDHVANVIEHGGPPDYRQWAWSLDATTKGGGATDGIPMRACVNPVCLQPYERVLPQCPHCGMEPPPPADRSKPEHVDGDVILYSEELLQKLFGERDKIDGPCLVPHYVSDLVANTLRKNHMERREAQRLLRATMEMVLPPSLDERHANRRFFHTFGIDTLTAQTLGCREAMELQQRIIKKVTTK